MKKSFELTDSDLETTIKLELPLEAIIHLFNAITFAVENKELFQKETHSTDDMIELMTHLGKYVERMINREDSEHFLSRKVIN